MDQHRWHGHRRRQRRRQEAGHLLPLAVGSSLLLVLSGLSAQTAALEVRWRLGTTLRLRRAEDALTSAAQFLVGELNQHHRCLLPLPQAEWEERGGACAGAERITALRSAEVLGHTYTLIAWQPLPPAAGRGPEVELLLELGGDEREPSRRAAFLVTLGAAAPGGDPEVIDLRSRGLRGVAS